MVWTLMLRAIGKLRLLLPPIDLIGLDGSVLGRLPV
jgi:hypothetical protein